MRTSIRLALSFTPRAIAKSDDLSGMSRAIRSCLAVALPCDTRHTASERASDGRARADTDGCLPKHCEFDREVSDRGDR